MQLYYIKRKNKNYQKQKNERTYNKQKQIIQLLLSYQQSTILNGQSSLKQLYQLIKFNKQKFICKLHYYCQKRTDYTNACKHLLYLNAIKYDIQQYNTTQYIKSRCKYSIINARQKRKERKNHILVVNKYLVLKYKQTVVIILQVLVKKNHSIFIRHETHTYTCTQMIIKDNHFIVVQYYIKNLYFLCGFEVFKQCTQKLLFRLLFLMQFFIQHLITILTDEEFHFYTSKQNIPCLKVKIEIELIKII
eukprot:TRINITY_DN17691_c1_g1_i1.p3 TRINITY_DN17691_c1_g1~~TRINITY_DN17691_c1_g1_i1.p3  ORF type:complete len:248 (-),score=-21.44 TRINITY_DN17691_c1_g1_i1:269-1012(-)